MGQRSQIYVRYYDRDGCKKIVVRYFQWCFGERMISRARYIIDWLEAHKDYIDFKEKELVRIIDTNFDMRDVVISLDIISEWRNSKTDDTETSEFIFETQPNNDGKLFIDLLPTGEIKYALTDYDFNIKNPEEYLVWDFDRDNWSSVLDAEDVAYTRNNIY